MKNYLEMNWIIYEKLNFYFDTSLWCLKRFYEGIQGLHKTFWGTTKKCENNNLIQFFSLRPGLGREGLKEYFLNCWFEV